MRVNDQVCSYLFDPHMHYMPKSYYLYFPVTYFFPLNAKLNRNYYNNQVMRRYGVPDPYEKLKELTRGRAVTKESMRVFIQGLELPQEAKTNLLKLTPHSYIGAAAELARTVDVYVSLVYGSGRS